MNSHFLIYITAPSSLLKSDWMSLFYNKLKMSVSRVLNEEPEWFIKGFNNTPNQELINKSNCFLTLLDESVNTDEEYKEELIEIAQILENNTSDRLNLFKICLSPSQNIHQPDIIAKENSYNFYEDTGRRNTIATINFDNKNSSGKAWNKILDLAYDFAKLKNDKTIEVITEEALANTDKQIYLTHCSTDIIHLHDEIKRELEQSGYKVLPSIEVNTELENYSQRIKEDLDRCENIVQLLGGKYGTVKKGAKYSFFEEENILINEALSDSETKKRIVWIPSSIKSREPKQDLYINRIKQKESNKSSDIIESSLDEFKDILSNRFIIKSAEPIKYAPLGEIYLISPPETNGINTKLNSLCHDLDLMLVTLDYKLEDTLYKQHLNLLKNSRNVIISWINNDVFWLKSKLRDLIKAPGLGKKEAFKSIAILSEIPIPELSEFSAWLPKIEILNTDNQDIKTYLQKIIE